MDKYYQIDFSNLIIMLNLQFLKFWLTKWL